MREPTTLQQLDYVYNHVDRKEGDPETAKKYLQDIAKSLDMLRGGDTCGGGETIPME